MIVMPRRAASQLATGLSMPPEISASARPPVPDGSPHGAERDDPKDLSQPADERGFLGGTVYQDPAERVAHLRVPQVGDRLPHIPHEPVDKESLVLPFEVDFAVPQQDVGHHGTTSARSSATACRSAEAAASISSGVVKRDRLNRRVDWASVVFSPMASKTWLGVGVWP